MHKRSVVWGFCLAWVLFLSTEARAGGTDPYGNEDPNKKILKSGVVGAATGAVAAGASGGKAGKGALIGAGTNVIGGAVLDALTTSPQPQPQRPATVYAASPPEYAGQQKTKHVIRKYGPDGKVISEEEVWE